METLGFSDFYCGQYDADFHISVVVLSLCSLSNCNFFLINVKILYSSQCPSGKSRRRRTGQQKEVKKEDSEKEEEEEKNNSAKVVQSQGGVSDNAELPRK